MVAPAMARTPIVLGNSGGSLTSELTELADLVRPTDTSCAEHCWVLDRMKLSGPLDKGSVDFELTGELLHKGSYEIPLFGPAEKLRLENVTQNGARATVGFEAGHYYFHTSETHFTLRGKFLVWAELLDQLNLRGDERILDMGCGRGARQCLPATSHDSPRRSSRTNVTSGVYTPQG